ncbi:BolA family protein [Alteromonas oceanisediminis]|uniref:BolA family protein n=1 Tax=Alteromonas oceanisediminis TaxID=2836180 RepID=UPI001BD9FE5E|nr:BolA/IbaG family iron-sulfur metabolism protein [Alteromonas oceanisediminis]MBT0585337.1 BolA/IbaG family iron-sulfur metabolism protein [Alteromonas oceanisediminis]
MIVQQRIIDKLNTALSPEYLQVENESHNHNVPAGSESHFKVTLVAPAFEGKRLIQRHRLVNQTLADELANDIHALALHTYTAAEWQSKFGQVPESPKCMGGEKR